MKSDGHETWLHTSTLGKAFPIDKKTNTFFEEIILHDDEKQISDNFGLGLKVSPFYNAGVMIDGKVYTSKVVHKEPKSTSKLGDFILSDDNVIEMYGEKYFIDDKDTLEKWKKQKGAKKIERINKKQANHISLLREEWHFLTILIDPQEQSLQVKAEVAHHVLSTSFNLLRAVDTEDLLLLNLNN